MHECAARADQLSGLVGDPVNVITGTNTDWNRDFRLLGPLPLNWMRYYDSSQNERLCPLGWGHTHEYDRSLQFDVDGVSYLTPVGKALGFPPLLRDGEEFARSGVVLRRVAAHVYQARQRDQPTYEFRFRESSPAAMLVRAFRGPAAIRFSYGPAAFPETIVDSLGRTIRVEHDDRGRILGLVLVKPPPDGERRLLTCRYDVAGNFVEGVDAYKNVFRFRYDANNRMISKTDQRGYSFHYEYDAEGRCVLSRGQDGLHEVRLSYRPAERATLVTRGDSGQWTYFHSPEMVLSAILDPYGGMTTFTVDEDGRPAKRIDPNGNVTRMLYDGAGALIGTATPVGEFRPRGYEARTDPRTDPRLPRSPRGWEYGDLLTRTRITLPAAADPAFRQLADSARRFLQVSVAEELASAAGGPRPETPAGRGRHTAGGRVYDDLGLLLSEAGPGGTARRWAHDAGGNRVRYHDRDGSLFTYEYTSWNFRSRETDPLGHSAAYRYTSNGKRAAVIDARGNAHEFAYDLKDRLTQVKRDGALAEQYRYDNADNLVERRDGQGETLVAWEVGPKNLPKVQRLAAGQVYALAHDPRGRLVRAASDALELQLAYDTFSNCTKDFRDGRGVTRRFGYQGTRLEEMTVLEKFTTQYRREPDGTVVIRDPGGKEHRVCLLGHGLALRRLSNGTSEVSQYDGEGRCVAKVGYSGRFSLPKWTRVYSYSGEGDLLSEEDSDHGTWQYSYDAAHRLIGARGPGGAELNFAYDAAGNLRRQPGLSDTAFGTGNRLLVADGLRFDYSDRGNVTARRGSEGETLYSYDALDMLVACETGRGAWRASYDPLGRRVSKAHGNRRAEYYWDGDRLAAEVDEAGRVRVYVYADGSALVPLLYMEFGSADANPASGRRFFLFCNQIGAPIIVEDDQGAPVWAARVAPYGDARVDPESRIDFPLRFPGHYCDPELGLHYNRFRYYSPHLGRYLQPDPRGVDGGLNLYAYTANPLARVDLRGEFPCPDDEEEEDDAYPRLPPLTDAEGQGIADHVQGVLGGIAGTETVTGVTEMEDGSIIITTNARTTRAMRDAIAELQEPGGPLEGRQVLLPDDPRNPGYIRPENRDLANAPVAGGEHHAEQRGIQAANYYNENGDGNEQGHGDVMNQWSSGGAGHGGASCNHCDAAQQANNVPNGTGAQARGGRFDGGGP